MEVLRVHVRVRSYFRCRDNIGCLPELLSRSLARHGPSNDAHSVTHCVMRNSDDSYGQANRSVVVQDRFVAICTGVPAAITVTPAVPAPAPTGRSRSGGQLGPKLKVKFRAFVKVEIAG